MTEDVKFVTGPEVFLVTRPRVDREAVARFLSGAGFPRRFADDHPHDAEQAVATGSRTCYASFDSGRKPDDHLAHLIEVGHGSVLEHATFGVLVAGVSRSLSHELVRHRHLSPSQLSQRYVDHADVRFVVPPALVGLDTSDAFLAFAGACRVALVAYRTLADQLERAGYAGKRAKEAARSVLPNCTETRLLLTGNLRAWRVLFERRCSRHADAEIRKLSNLIFEAIRPHAPAVFADYELEPLGDGTYEIHTESQRV